MGLNLAKHYVHERHTVCITGRHDPALAGSTYIELNIDADSLKLITSIESLLESFPAVNTLIYAAGYCQRAHIDELSDAEIMQMVNVGLVAPTLLVQRLNLRVPSSTCLTIDI